MKKLYTDAALLELLESREEGAFRAHARVRRVRLRPDTRSERRTSQFALGTEQYRPGTGQKRHPIPAAGWGA
jgi:hypothetical protein